MLWIPLTDARGEGHVEGIRSDPELRRRHDALQVQQVAGRDDMLNSPIPVAHIASNHPDLRDLRHGPDPAASEIPAAPKTPRSTRTIRPPRNISYLHDFHQEPLNPVCPFYAGDGSVSIGVLGGEAGPRSAYDWKYPDSSDTIRH